MSLKQIPKILSPDLLHALCAMGHGDEIVLADIHFPTASICRSGPKEIRADGLLMADVLQSVTKLLPLDQYAKYPVALMEQVEEDLRRNIPVPIWNVYQEIINASEGRHICMEYVERFAFYERAKKAFAVVHTGEASQYANIILKKGCILD